ncbi:hypothetical protein ABPG74_016404 [Tetrahymena malaccensis]
MSNEQEINQSQVDNSIAFDIYGLIWKHENSSNQYTFKVPNTIVFKNHEPILWIYSNSNNQVMKKTAEILKQEQIKGFFNNIKNISGIAAQYIFQINDKLQIKYLMSDEISNFLDQKNNLLQDGILQQFIDPNSQRNSVIQASTNYQSCVLLKFINKQNIYNQQINLNDRACTLDGLSQKIDSISLKGKICPLIKQCINEIQSNIILNQEGGQKVKKITCYFKEDEKENIHFLWANYVKVEKNRSRSQQSKSQTFQRQPIYQEKTNYSSIQSQKNSNILQELKPEKSLQQHSSSSIHKKFLIECYQCSQKKVKESFIEISYKYLIDYQLQIDQSCIKTDKLNIPESVKQYKNQFTKKPQQVYHIPRVVQIIHPNLKYPTYVCIKESPQFQNKKVEVCSECYYEIIEKVTQKASQIHLQSMRNVKRSISVGNNRSQGSISSYITQSDQKYPHRIRLASAKQNHLNAFPQQFQISPQKIIEDDSECSQPTVFVKALEKLALGVHSLSGFQSRNNIDNLDQSNYSTGINNFNSIFNQVNRPKNCQSDAQILNLKYKKSLQSQDSLLKSVNCSNGFAIKKVFSTYSYVEEGMDVPQMSQSSYKYSGQNKESEKVSTKQCTSERQSLKNENVENSSEKNQENTKKISVKGLLESQKLQNQLHDKKELNTDQANIEDITLFNLVKQSDKKDEKYNFLNIQKSPEYSNTPTFQHIKQNQNPTKNDDVLNKNILAQELNEQPYQFRLSFGNQTFEEYQSFLKAKQLQDGLKDISKQESKSYKPSFFQESKQEQKNNEIILINNEQITLNQEDSDQKERKKSQSSSSKFSDLDIRKSSQRSLNQDYIKEDIQKFEDSSLDQEQNKKILNSNHESKEVDTVQESILTSEAENPEIKQTQKQTAVLNNNFTKPCNEIYKSGKKTLNNNIDLPVNMISNTNHIPIKKERGLFNVKKIQSTSKLNQTDKKN